MLAGKRLLFEPQARHVVDTIRWKDGEAESTAFSSRFGPVAIETFGDLEQPEGPQISWQAPKRCGNGECFALPAGPQLKVDLMLVIRA